MGFRPVVRIMAVLQHQFPIKVNVEDAMPGRYELAATDVVPMMDKNLARYPSGP